jgi:hypothetical protein
LHDFCLFFIVELDVRHSMDREISLEEVDLEADLSALDDFLQDVDKEEKPSNGIADTTS